MKHICKAALCFLPLVLLLAAVNFYADPANVLRTGYEERVAAILAQGDNASNLRNMDDRTFMRTYTTLRTQPIDTLVLGSSRSMQVTSEIIGDANMFTAGMTGSDLRDCISVYRMVREKGFSPKRVLLCVEPWYLSDATLEPRALTEGYIEFCKENGYKPLQISGGVWDKLVQKAERLSQIISIPYFQSSVVFLQKGLHKNREPMATQEMNTQTDIRRADGSYGYNAALRTVLPEETYDRAKDYMRVKPPFARKFTVINEILAAQLETFVREMQQDGVEVAFMISPFHPDYYEYIVQQKDNYVEILKTEEVFHRVAAACGIKVMGAYNPALCGVDAVDFYDGLHCSSQGIKKMYPADLFSTLRR